VKDTPTPDRPREKLDRIGSSGLGDNELLAIVLGQGSRHATVLSTANDVLDAVGGLRGLGRAALGDLRRIRGIGPVRAAQIIAAIELGRRTVATGASERPRLNHPAALAAYLLPLYGARTLEHFGIVMLDTRHRLIRTSVLSVGSLDTNGDTNSFNWTFGTFAVTQAFAPVLAKNGGGAIANLNSVASFVSFPILATYSASKAATHSLTQVTRAMLRGQNTQVFGVYPGPIDTRMGEALTIEKASPADAARAIVAGIIAGDEEIFPDTMSQGTGPAFFANPKGLERQVAGRPAVA